MKHHPPCPSCETRRRRDAPPCPDDIVAEVAATVAHRRTLVGLLQRRPELDTVSLAARGPLAVSAA